MNRTRQLATTFALVAAFATFATATAHADGGTPDYPQAYSSSLSRAAVKADLRLAQAAGQIAVGEHSLVLVHVGMPLSRAQVKAETREAQRLGLTQIGDQTVVPTLAQLQQIRLAGLAAVPMTLALR